MLTTLVLVLSGLALLSLVGLCVLSATPAGPTRDRLVLVAPVIGAALIAVVTNWSCRWLSAPHSVPVVLAVTVLPLAWGIRRGTARGLLRFATLRQLTLGPAMAAAGLCVAAVPVMVVGDINPVAPSYNVDQLYFAGVSTWLMEHPLLPGPVLTDSWTGDSVPSAAPAADTVYLSLRFGQSAVSAVLSVLLLHPPFQLVTSMSLIWLLALGSSTVFLLATLEAPRRVAAMGAAVVTGSFFVVSQALEGKNDGLLGASLALVVLGLCYAEMHDSKVGGPLVLLAAGLVASYSEYLLLLVPILFFLAVVGPRSLLLHRLNRLAWPWALTAFLVPMAWVWMVKSFKQATRFTDGPTPFSRRADLGYLRAAMGLPEVPGATVALSVLAAVLLAGLVVGWVAVLRRHPARGALIGLLVVVGVLELNAFSSGSGNLSYRVAQLGAPGLLAFSVLGWGVLIVAPSMRGGRHLAPRVRSWWRSALLAARPSLPGVATVLAVLFVAANLTSTALTTSHARAESQHVPKPFTDALGTFADSVGWQNVSVLAPKLTDVSALSLALASRPSVQYPVIPNASSYVGTNPLWDLVADRYYVVGPGAQVLGSHTTLIAEGDYRVVTLGEDGLLIVPFQTALWPRITWMRGYTCGRQGLALLILRGGTGRTTFDMAARPRVTADDELRLQRSNEKFVRVAGQPRVEGSWQRRTYVAPQQQVSIVSIDTPPEFASTGTTAFPLKFTAPRADLVGRDEGDEQDLVEFCLSDANDGTDGYDRELTQMRGPW